MPKLNANSVLLSKGLTLCLSLAIMMPSAFASTTDHSKKSVQIHSDQLWIDGQAQPQLYGAELQYFRLRGGQGRNIPRSQVIALWNQALDRMVEAKMNAIGFYIPWDFHEYAEGQFDFNGTVDEDGDGNADYPSRDVNTFFKLIAEHGIKHILVRPGPYINAEWGFLGFGAIPLWFHEKYPNSHARNSKGQKTTLFSYLDADFLRHSEIWLQTVYHQVLKSRIGAGKPISFIQVDNETNFMWQSIYNHDYGPNAVQQYQTFLKDNYLNLTNLNANHGRQWKSWNEILPPVERGPHLAEDQDWYRFQDFSLFSYLKKIRKVWTNLGVNEPEVLFILAESYNATENGLLPNYKFRNSKEPGQETGMMTVNLYPKTYETPEEPLLNLPFKADHDVKAADAATDSYLGRREAWVMGPEIQGGWWRGTGVTTEARQQTYLTTIGHGLKALFIYYFHEGDNWQPHWMKTAILPYYNSLKNSDRFQAVLEKDLPDAFWRDLDAEVANRFMAVNTRDIWRNNGTQSETLYFDAPLGPDAKPRAPYQLIKDIGQKIIAPYGDFLGQAHELEDPVCLIKDSDAHVPSSLPGVNSRVVQSDWMAGLLGLLMHSGINPRIHHWNLNPTADLLDSKKCKLVIHQDTGLTTAELSATLLKVIEGGGAVLSLINPVTANIIRGLKPQADCAALPLAPMNVEGYRCQIGAGSLYYAKIPIYDVFNTDFYYQIHDAQERRSVIDRILSEVEIIPQVQFDGGGDRSVLFARASPDEKQIWVTAKTAKLDGFSARIKWTRADVGQNYAVTDVLVETTIQLTGAQLAQVGFSCDLGKSGSKSYFIRPLISRPKEKNSR
ncbi:MAG: beta-galactosidase [Bdellovibrionaceae bacterium]|nr:beta-galactosidase [Bdellovibrio sp.]